MLKSAPRSPLFTSSGVTSSFKLSNASMRALSSQSSIAEPDQSLFQASRSVEDDDLDKQLRSDVKTMGSILGATIKTFAGKDIFDKVETLRLSAKVSMM